MYKRTGNNIDIPLDQMMNIALKYVKQGEHKINENGVPVSPAYWLLEDERMIEIPENMLADATKMLQKGIQEYHYPTQTDSVPIPEVDDGFPDKELKKDLRQEILDEYTTDPSGVSSCQKNNHYETYLMCIAFLVILFYGFRKYWLLK